MSNTDSYRPRYQLFLFGIRGLLLFPFLLVLAILKGIFLVGLIPSFQYFAERHILFGIFLPFAFAFQKRPTTKP